MFLYTPLFCMKALESTPVPPQITPKPGQGSSEFWTFSGDNAICPTSTLAFPIMLLKHPAMFSVLELRHRNVIPKAPPVVVNPASEAAARPPLASRPTYPGRSSHSAPGGPPERSLSAIAAQQSLMRKPVTPGTPVPGVGELPAHRGTRS